MCSRPFLSRRCTPMSKRVVVTGMSVNTAIGDTLADFRDGLMAGRSALSRWKAFPADRIYSKVGGDLSGYDVDAKVAALASVMPADVHKRLRKLAARVPWTTKLSMLLAVDGLDRRRPVRRRLRSDAAGGCRLRTQPQCALPIQQPHPVRRRARLHRRDDVALLARHRSCRLRVGSPADLRTDLHDGRGVRERQRGAPIGR